MNRFYSTVVAVGLFTYAMLASPVADARSEDPSRFDFNVFLNDKKIGTHSFELQSENGIREVKSVANFKYTVFFIPAYRYEQATNAGENWEDNQCYLDVSDIKQRRETRRNQGSRTLNIAHYFFTFY